MFIGETIEIAHANGDVETLDDVLVAPEQQADIPMSTGQEERVAYTLHFPEGYTGDLVHARITLRGERYRVLGLPKAYTAENNPLDWNMPVKVARLNYTHELEIQRAYSTLSSKGDSVTQWQTLLTTYCRVQDAEQDEESRAGRIEATKRVQITFDWIDDLKTLYNTTARALVDGEVFDITSIKNANWEDDICIISAVHNGE